MIPRHLPRAAVALLLVAAACTDVPPTEPAASPDGHRAGAVIRCTADVRGGSVTCAEPAPASGARRSVTMGGQHVYVRLASTNQGYDADAGRFRMDVTLQNLLAQPMGTPDGATVTGARVFFATLGVTEGNGVVEVANPDGEGLFSTGTAPYFHYPQIILPRGTSAPRRWEFAVPPSVTRFAFTVYVETELPAEEGVLRWETVEGGGVGGPGQFLAGVWAGGRGDVWAVGMLGAILHWDGTSWAAVHNPDPQRTQLNAVWGADPSHVYAAGAGVVLGYDGNRWTVRSRHDHVEIRALAGTSADAVYAVGTTTVNGRNDGAVLRLAAGGTSGTLTALAGPARASDGARERDLRGVAAEGATVLAVGDQRDGSPENHGEGVVLRSTDAGATWSAAASPGPSYPYDCGGATCTGRSRILRGVAMRGGVAYAVGWQQTAEGATDGVILRSADGGATWTETLSRGPTYGGVFRNRELRAVTLTDAGEVFLFGSQNDADGATEDLVLRSADGGATWSAASPATTDDLLYAGSSSGSEVWAAGGQSTVLRLSGGTWREEQTTIPQQELRGVWVDAAGNAVAVGLVGAEPQRDGWVRRWNGSAWSSVVLPAPPGPGGSRSRILADVAGAGSRVLAVGYQADAWGDRQGVILVSADGGASWSSTASPGPEVQCSVVCVRSERVLTSAAAAHADTLFVAGSQRAGINHINALVLRSTDGGATWSETVLEGPPISCGTGCTRRLRALSGVAAGGGGRVYGVGQMSVEGGASEGVILHSTDGGVSWSETRVPRADATVEPILASVWAAGLDVVVVGTERNHADGPDVGLVMRSADGGVTWTRSQVRSAAWNETRFLRVWGAGPGHLYAAGPFGVLMRSRDGGATWQDQASGTTRGLYGLGGNPAGTRIFAVGMGGAIVRGTR